MPLNKKHTAKILAERDGFSISFHKTAVVGTFVAELFCPYFPMPIAFMWLRKQSSTLQILNCYVPEKLRRNGLMTWLFVATIKRLACVHVVTEAHTDLSKPWLESLGFRFSKRSGWMLPIEILNKLRAKRQ